MAQQTGPVLGDVIAALDTAVHWTETDAGEQPRVGRVAILDADDLASGTSMPTDLALLVGVDAASVRTWLSEPGEQKPAAVLTKAFGRADEARDLVADSGVALVGLDVRARWDRVLASVQATVDRAHQEALVPAGFGAPVDVDLTGLVGLVAQGTGGLVSIEDATSARVLAYSPSNGAADDLRVQTILGREGPTVYLALLREWGVFDAIRKGGEVVDVPEHPEQAMRRRLVVGVHSGAGRHLGSIWVQEGAAPLSVDAAEVLRGAAAVAARILTREMQAPSTEMQIVERLLGEHGGIDASSAGAYLRWPTDDAVAVVGVAAAGESIAGHSDEMASVGGSLRLHASAFAPSALTAVIGERAYLLMPAAAVEPVTRWARGLVARFDGDPSLQGSQLHAAVVHPVGGLAGVAGARDEVDRVLSATSMPRGDRVTTLAQARTAVLLGEIVDAIVDRDELVDPRVAALGAYDAVHASQLVPSLQAYLDAHGNVRDAARRLDIHPNTLRYRIDRAQQMSGLRLDDPADRLLTALQLAAGFAARGGGRDR
ncbi:PucR family transcriptional regulator [Gordonia zhaorongruii]|uniref:PucR family transcriptional regulator n=1 Tax=Gordonia zhaorongruii TaxID=2597659 RepID=UPI00104A87C2|nr:helix-turn-helix domain-containing protein [Gordonia zhaorongruii]